jgi:hypothetical protein
MRQVLQPQHPFAQDTQFQLESPIQRKHDRNRCYDPKLAFDL